MKIRIAVAIGVLLLALASLYAAAKKNVLGAEHAWPGYGGGPADNRYSSLKQITPET